MDWYWKAPIVLSSPNHSGLMPWTLHFSHLGFTKTILRAWTSVFWPGLNADIKELTDNCQECAKHSSQQCTETVHNDLVTTQPWIALACDLFEYESKINLIVVDHYSKFIAVEPVADRSAEKTINAFLQIFSKLGIPTTIYCDHGSNFTPQMFITFCSNPDISLSYSSGFHHSSNQLNELLELWRTSWRNLLMTILVTLPGKLVYWDFVYTNLWFHF